MFFLCSVVDERGRIVSGAFRIVEGDSLCSVKGELPVMFSKSLDDVRDALSRHYVYDEASGVYYRK